MRPPRWLVVLVVVLVVLQGASCALPALDLELGLSPERLGELLDPLTPDPPPVDLADVTACETVSASGELAFVGACRVAVAPASGSVRRLVVERVTGSIRMSLSADPDVSRALDTEDVDVPPDEQVQVDLICASPACAVRLGD
jgi:hypothetical protein